MVVGPIAIDVLDFERYAAGVGITLAPSTLLAFFAGSFNDVLPNRPVEIHSCR
jgi:hypothetical protein